MPDKYNRVRPVRKARAPRDPNKPVIYHDCFGRVIDPNASRDPKGTNAHIKIQFEDVLAEPDEFHSCECCWRCTRCCYRDWMSCCYKWMTFWCACCLAVGWGCEFARITFLHIWCIHPGFKLCKLCIKPCEMCYAMVIKCCIAPIFEAGALFFSEFEDPNRDPELPSVRWY